MKSISHELRCLQPSEAKELTQAQRRDIAALIYQTDPYIYPAMFRSQENAERLIPELMLRGDAMFCAENLFVCMAGETVAGIILWHQGPMDWDPALFEECASALGIKQSPYLALVKDQYFSAYREAPEDWISILNVCTKAEFRDYGVGSFLLRSFFEAHRDCRQFELFVLADNQRAIHVYQKYGFSTAERLQGFSIDNRDLPCLRMVKTI